MQYPVLNWVLLNTCSLVSSSQTGAHREQQRSMSLWPTTLHCTSGPPREGATVPLMLRNCRSAKNTPFTCDCCINWTVKLTSGRYSSPSAHVSPRLGHCCTWELHVNLLYMVTIFLEVNDVGKNPTKSGHSHYRNNSTEENR